MVATDVAGAAAIAAAAASGWRDGSGLLLRLFLDSFCSCVWTCVLPIEFDCVCGGSCVAE